MSQLIQDLKDKEIDFDNLVVVSCGHEQYLGELGQDCDFTDSYYNITHPKRFARFEMRHPQNPGMIIVDFMIGDLDFINSGIIQVRPTMAYWISSQDLDCQINMAKLYLEYFDRKIKAKAVEAGLYIPESNPIKSTNG